MDKKAVFSILKRIMFALLLIVLLNTPSFQYIAQTYFFLSENLLLSGILYALAVLIIASIPSSGLWLVYILGGSILGMILSTILGSFMLFIAATSTFLGTRYTGDKVLKPTKKKPNTVAQFWGTIVLRNIIVLPYVFVSAYIARKHISYATFIVASILGSLPLLLFFTYVGSQSLEIVSNATGTQLYIGVFLLTFFFVSKIFMQKKVIRKLSRKK
ncbi:MAG: VTT domain-containing protein [Candidatus Woesearchaeota archaeon]